MSNRKNTNQFSSPRWTPRLKKELIEWLNQGQAKSNLEIAIWLEISERTLYTWKNDHADFADIIEYAKTKRKQLEIERFQRGETSPQWFDFTMRCQYGEMDECQRVNLELKRRELDAKIAANNFGTSDSKPINISFSIKSNDEIEAG